MSSVPLGQQEPAERGALLVISISQHSLLSDSHCHN